MNPLDDRMRFLRAAGIGEVEHNSSAGLLAHLAGTRRLLASWQARPALCDAGLFHSVYGTEYFGTAALSIDRRAEVRSLIGVEAEQLVWLWCFMRRCTLYDNMDRYGDFTVQHRETDEWLPLSRQQLIDLANLWIADAVEQIDRIAPGESDFAKGLLRLRPLALPRALASLDAKAARFGI